MKDLSEDLFVSKSLRVRTADFLAKHPPFMFLDYAVLEELCGKVRIKYIGDGQFIFKSGEAATHQVYVLKRGGIALIREKNEESILVDMCDEGDTFGMRSYLTGNPYSLSAKAVEEALIFIFDQTVFRPILESNSQVSVYYAAGFAAGQTIVRSEAPQQSFLTTGLINTPNILLSNPSQTYFREEDIINIRPIEELVYCSKSHSIQEAAQKMLIAAVDSILVLNDKLGVQGIVTQSDMAKKVCTGQHLINEPIEKIMSSPVITLAPDVSISTVMIHMVRHHIRHIVITDDGTLGTPAKGIITEHDVLVNQGNNIAVLAKRMSKASSVAELAEIRKRVTEIVKIYLQKEISIDFITQMLTAINDILIGKAIKFSQEYLADEGANDPQLAFCWLSLGSEGRGEQILQTDQDHAILYEDAPLGKEEEAQKYFLALGKAVTDILVLSGFALCPGEIMAGHVSWNRSLSGWKQHLSKWVRHPSPQSLLNSTIFFDFRVTFGDETLAQSLRTHLYQETEKEASFPHFLARHAADTPPPLSFLKQFVVERSGDHKHMLDIKLRGMLPLANAARVLILTHNEAQITNTSARYTRLAELEPTNASRYLEAKMAYELMMRLRALNGFQLGDSGRYIQPTNLNKIERKTLKSAFRAIEDIQRLLKTRFMLDMFR